MHSNKAILANPIHLVAFGFGAGLSPKAPGSVGTIVAVLIYLVLPSMPPIIYAGLVLLSFFFGIWICGKTAEDLGVHDHGGIVWDEFVGYWITMFMAPSGLFWVLLGFVFFRLLDIFKPWPIKWADKELAGGLGIMLDDVLAGIMAALGMQAVVVLIG
ncbi:MAG: phosphatidylglycerophosphatase A [Gammaproteobacteria bacterium]|jgi:phosphatidylglycerophosphatase A|nr:phosphatidylglycerophosphatase A [Gammaproteobacteria bacterium]|tara:strand:- start:88 stop:561 length:474 start_codon:yes stop_codon:yes gene_type:complete